MREKMSPLDGPTGVHGHHLNESEVYVQEFMSKCLWLCDNLFRAKCGASGFCVETVDKGFTQNWGLASRGSSGSDYND